MRTIQNNVRGWILRKNYTNLREAARVLQVAWREKRRVSVPHGMFNPATGQHQQQQRIGSPASQSEDKSPTSNLRDSMDSTGGPAYVQSGGSNNSNSGGGGASGAMDVVAANGPGITLSAEPNPTQQMAAATLQAATRAMLSRRRSFSSVRKQTMASLVIQKSLVKWWEHSKVGAQESAAVGAARISAHSTG